MPSFSKLREQELSPKGTCRDQDPAPSSPVTAEISHNATFPPGPCLSSRQVFSKVRRGPWQPFILMGSCNKPSPAQPTAGRGIPCPFHHTALTAVGFQRAKRGMQSQPHLLVLPNVTNSPFCRATLPACSHSWAHHQCCQVWLGTSLPAPHVASSSQVSSRRGLALLTEGGQPPRSFTTAPSVKPDNHSMKPPNGCHPTRPCLSREPQYTTKQYFLLWVVNK